MKKYLIVTMGFLGDIMFASSIAKHLKDEQQIDIVDYLIGFPQVFNLIKNNYIDNIFVSNPIGPKCNPNNYNNYTNIINLQELNYIVPPTIEFQEFCKINNTNNRFYINTINEYDKQIYNYFETIKQNGKKIICVLKDWKEKSFLFTEEQYNIGIDVHTFGYGGKHRDTDFIIKELANKYNLIFVGDENNKSQFNNFERTFEQEASILKYCDCYVGATGGISTLAVGINTKTIITTDFIWQLYGPNGCIKKIENPKLETKYYGEVGKHFSINPFATDIEVLQNIYNIIGS